MENSTLKRSRKVFIKDEDFNLVNAVLKNPDLNWKKISNEVQTRTARQCRDRWVQYLSMKLYLEEWKKEEDELLIQAVQNYGKKWSLIKQLFPRRSYSCVKNRWYSYLCKKYIDQPQEKNLTFKNDSLEWKIDFILLKNLENQDLSWFSNHHEDAY